MATISKKKLERWTRLIAQWQQSGLTIKKFCKENRLTISNFYKWRKQLTHSQPAAPGMFIPVTLPTMTQQVILLYPNGCKLQFTGLMDTAVLQQLNQAMGVFSC